VCNTILTVIFMILRVFLYRSIVTVLFFFTSVIDRFGPVIFETF